ncbi:MAG: hypothetical protein KGP10_08180 [Actinomycetales bacterium]|nr:hypothetical protein [Actinomycetales bacterium]
MAASPSPASHGSAPNPAPPKTPVWRRLATLGCALGVAACGGSAPPTPPQADLVGTWVGDYRYPSAGTRVDPTGVAVSATERITITAQEGELLWGYQTWVDAGITQRDLLHGSIGSDDLVVLTEAQGHWLGRFDGEALILRYIRTGKQRTTYEVTLRRADLASP